MTQDSGQPAPADTQLTVAVVDDARWADLQQLFEGRGGPHYCWCMAWREMPSKLRRDKVAKKAELKRRVEDRTPVGIVGYVSDQPVAWCSVGPRPSFRRLSEKDHCDPGETVWSIVCFFIHRKFRGLGFTQQMIEAAVRYARENGATVIEAYPVDKSSPSYRYMGFPSSFERAGFVNVGRTGKWHQVMQLRST